MQSHKQQEMYARIDIEGNATKKNTTIKLKIQTLEIFIATFFPHNSFGCLNCIAFSLWLANNEKNNVY